MTVVYTRTVVKSGFHTRSPGSWFHVSTLTVQSIARMASRTLALTASAEGPQAESQATKRPRDKSRIQWGRYPRHPKTVEGCVCEWVCFECDSHKVCVLACEGAAHFLHHVFHRASLFPVHVTVAQLGAWALLTYFPCSAWPAFHFHPCPPTVFLATVSLGERWLLYGLTGL